MYHHFAQTSANAGSRAEQMSTAKLVPISLAIIFRLLHYIAVEERLRIRKRTRRYIYFQ